jgi:hypothetical protein
MMNHWYRIEVSFSGKWVSEHTIEAPDALTAINLIEAQYGLPAQVEYKTVFHENGSKEHILDVSDWHGYSFLARQIPPLDRRQVG